MLSPPACSPPLATMLRTRLDTLAVAADEADPMAYLKSEVERLHNERESSHESQGQKPQAAAGLSASSFGRHSRAGHIAGISHCMIQHDGTCASFQRHPCTVRAAYLVLNGDNLLLIGRSRSAPYRQSLSTWEWQACGSHRS